MRYRSLATLTLVALPALLAACSGSPSAPDMKWADPAKITYYPGLHVDLSRMTRTANGTFYWDSIHGTGTEGAQQSDRVTVHYTLWFPDGTLIDNGSGKATNFRLLPDSVILGWVDGLTGAVQGTTRQLVIPPDEGYGASGSFDGRIPPYTTLIFLISVDKITHVSASGTVVPASPPPAEVAEVPALTRAVAGAFAAGPPPPPQPELTAALAGALARSARTRR